MKVERIITKTGEIYGVEVLARDFCENKEEFFRTANGLTDLLLFQKHIELIELFKGNVYFFLNLKPFTLIEYFEKVLVWARKNPHVVIELTEEYLTPSQEKRLVRLRTLLTNPICLDDFGMQASNYHRISLLRPEFIKVDIKAVGRLAIEDVIRGLRKVSSSSKIVVEKIETEEDYLASLSGDLFQGYYFERI